MKQFLLFLFVCLSSASSFAQSCTLSGDADFCVACSSLINASTGVVSGVITVPNNSGTETIPATCDFGSGPVPLILGSLTIDVRTNSNLLIADNIGVTGATNVTFTGNGTAVLTVGGTVFGNQVNADPNFADLQAAVTACIANPACTTIGGAVTALPVSLLSWDARKVPGGVSLQWASSEEVDNDFYLIEHSTDGNTFTELARISGQTNSSAEVAYEYVHEKPAAGAHFYRLGQQDFDGTRRELGIRRVQLVGAAELHLSPNPVKPGGELFLSLDTEDPTTTVSLYSMVGKVVASYPVVAGEANRINLPANLPAGVYLVRTELKTVRLLVR